MYLQRLLAINMASFAALGTILLALGEQNPILAVAAVLAAMLAVWVTDILCVFRLNRRVTNVAVLLAVLRSLWELFQIQGSVQVIAIANLLAYVMIILLFQEKDFRTWWHIALLSILQVAASATFFHGIWFAPLLLLYFFLGVSAIALLFLHNERTHYHQVRHRPIVPRDNRTVSDRLGVNWRRLGKIILATFIVGPLSLFLDYGEADNKNKTRKRRIPKGVGTSRWPLIHDEAEFTGSADSLGGRAGVGIEFYRHLIGLIPGTLVVAVLLFMFIPRFGRFDLSPFRWNVTAVRGSSSTVRTTGFSSTVELGEEGNLTEDPAEIIRVRLLDPATDQPRSMQGKVYLRGALLDNYEWGKWDLKADYGPRRFYGIETDPSGGLVKQQISVAPLDSGELFCVWPFIALQRDRRLEVDHNARRLVRVDPQRDDAKPYELGTYAIVDGIQVALTPNSTQLSPKVEEQLLQIPRDDLEGLIHWAGVWIEESELDETQVMERARYLESKFTNSDRFAYSLAGQPREPGVDPIEDFVITMPLGHCEYFATALALMLRSQGIPSRVVNGFVTNEYLRSEQYFRVRQRDAHSWVEAYIPREHLPETRPYGKEDANWKSGGWLRLDPTPSRTAATGFTALVDNVESWFEWVQDAWRTYVVQMNGIRQQKDIYDPIKSLALELKNSLIDVDGWRDLWELIKSLPGQLRSLLADAGWFSWVGMTLLLSSLGFGYFAYRTIRWSVQLVVWLIPRRNSRSGRRAQIAFYRRLETLLARHGLRRRPGQTHREFALVVGHHLANGQAEQAEAAALLVTEAFYEVRFGAGSLDSFGPERVEQALRDLEQAASGRPIGPKPA
jgi:transglutaminase-like putative cysteine protease